MKKFALAGIAAMAIAPLAMAGGTWDETADGGGDAGDLPGTVQVTNGSGSLVTITGNIANGSDVDAFLIQIKDAENLYIEVLDTNFDPQTFLFDPAGVGIVHNDDYPGLGLGSAINNAAYNAGAHGNGNFIIAVSGFNRDPLDAGGQAIFSFSSYDGNQQRIPNDADPYTQWSGTGGAGDYTITMRGVSYVPAPGALALLGAAGVIARRRRRA